MDDKIAERLERYEDTSRISPKLKGLAGPQRVSWRLLQIGSMVWAPTGKGWTPATVTRLGRIKSDQMVVHLTLHRRNGERKGLRHAGQLFWRKNREKPGSSAQ